MGRSPTPDSPSLGRAAGAHYPLAVGAGLWAWGPVTNPTARALASSLCALSGRHEGAWGGAPLAWVWGVRDWALFQARPPVLGACGRGLLPTGCGRGGCERGTRHKPHSARSCERFCALWGSTGGRASCLGVGRPGLVALPRPTAGPCGVRPGPATHWLRLRGVWGWDPSSTPQHALLRADFARCGGGMRAPGGGGGGGGGALACVWGVRGWALSNARLPALGPCCRGLLPTDCGCGVCGPGDPSPTPQRTLASGFARCGAARGRHGEGRLLPGCRASRGWALSHARPPILGACGWGPLPTGCGCGGCERGNPSPTPQRALLQAGFARCGGGTRAPRGGASCLRVGLPGLGALPCPTARPWGVRSGPATHWLCVRAVWAWVPVTIQKRALLRADFARCGGGTRAPRWAPIACVWGVRDWALIDARPPVFGVCGRGLLPAGCGCGARAWGPAVLGTFSCAAVCRVLCVLPGFASPGGHCCLAPVLVPWFWPGGASLACLVAPRWCAAPLSSGRSRCSGWLSRRHGASPIPVAVAHGFTGRLRGARGGRPGTGLIVPATGSCRARGPGLAPRHTCSGPREGVVPGRSLRLLCWAA